MMYAVEIVSYTSSMIYLISFMNIGNGISGNIKVLPQKFERL
jgi:hypothetical protein